MVLPLVADVVKPGPVLHDLVIKEILHQLPGGFITVGFRLIVLFHYYYGFMVL